MLHFGASSVFVLIVEQLHRLKKEAVTEPQSAYVTELVLQVEKDKDKIIQKIEYVQSLVTDAERLEQNSNYNLGIQVQDAFVEIKHEVAEMVTSWNERIHDTELQQKKQDKNKLQAIVSNSTNNNTSKLKDNAVAVNGTNNVTDNFSMRLEDGGVLVTMGRTADEEREDCPEVRTSGTTSNRANTCAINVQTGSSSAILSDTSSSSLSPVPIKRVESSASATSASDVPPDYVVPDTTLDSSTEKSLYSVSSTKGSSESSSPPKSVFIDAAEPVSTSVVTQLRSRSASDLRKVKGLSKEASTVDAEKKDRTTGVKQIFSNFLSNFGTTAVPIPFPTEEHHLLSITCAKVPVVVYDQEPSSIIAFTLSSYEYERQLQELKMSQTWTSDGTSVKKGIRLGDGQTDADVKRGVVSFRKSNGSREKSPSRSVGKFQVEAVVYTPNSDRDSLDDTDEADGFQVVNDIAQKASNKSNKQQPPNFHIELQFSDCNAKFYCRICYAEQFAKLRKLIFPEGEERYIRSLSRCFTWLARGGKSGSSFCKTQDDRFILKQMSRIEVQSFNEFAPHYFQYITKAYESEKPTAIAKILGVYRIGYQNSKTGNALKQDLLVMENLFYGHTISQIFDLKGSSRNRLVSTSGKRVDDMVLLDENLVKASIESPMYIFSHSKAVLMSSITRDTEFLANHSVMDYSLLVGVNESEKQFVIGIIDYIRTFTWDKKVEMIVKTAYGKEAPTVVQPENYKRRFLEAMDRYFPIVPDRWHGHGLGIL